MCVEATASSNGTSQESTSKYCSHIVLYCDKNIFCCLIKDSYLILRRLSAGSESHLQKEEILPKYKTEDIFAAGCPEFFKF